MEFGKLAEINHVNWQLPPEDPLTQAYLNSLQPRTKRTRVLVGAPSWGRREWLGKIYPVGTKNTEFLSYYAHNFQCVEFNSTHYRIPNNQQIQKWTDAVPDGFEFLPKIHQSISHEPGGLTNDKLLQTWLQTLPMYGKKLGPCFLQLPPNFSTARKAELYHFLKSWPDQFPLALEFRHESWFEMGRIRPALTTYLQSRGIALVITDVAGRRDVLHASISAPFSLLRLIGNNLHPSDLHRMEDWANRLKTWQHQGLQKFYLIVHQPDDILLPEAADQSLRVLNEICESNLPALKWKKQESLFGESE